MTSLKSKASTSKLKSFLLIFSLIFLVIATSFVLYFNGQRVKEPLIKYIKDHTGLELQIENVDFSLLYPNTISLSNVAFNSVNIGSLYIEYDAVDFLFNNKLYIKDLYLNNLSYDAKDQENIEQSLAQFTDFKVQSLRIENSNFEVFNIKAKNSNLQLNNVSFVEGKLSADSGNLNLQKITASPYEQYKLRALSFDYTKQNKFYLCTNFYAQLLGGTINSNQVLIDISTSNLQFDELYAAKLIIKDLKKLDSKLKLSANKFYSTNLGIFLNDLNLNNINGNGLNLNLTNNDLSFVDFNANIDEIAALKLALGLTENKVKLNLKDKVLYVSLNSNFLEGKVKTQTTIDFNEHKLYFDDLSINNTKFEFNLEHLNFIKKLSQLYNITLKSFELNNLNILSFVNKLPISIEKLNINGSNLNIKDTKIIESKAGIISIDATNILYSDLYIKNITTIATLSSDVINLSIPNIEFKSSHMSGALTLSQKNGQSFMLASASDFDLSDLNSNLIPNIFYGKVSFDLDFRSKGKDILKNAQGSFNLVADEVLISRFGLDLINGGDSKTRTLTPKQLYEALFISDVGIYNLKTDASLNANKLNLKSKFNLTSNQVDANFNFDLNKLNIIGNALFSSNIYDNKTTLTFDGNYPDIKIKLTPINRQTKLAGLFNTNEHKKDELVTFNFIKISSKLAKIYQEIDTLLLQKQKQRAKTSKNTKN